MNTLIQTRWYREELTARFGERSPKMKTPERAIRYGDVQVHNCSNAGCTNTFPASPRQMLEFRELPYCLTCSIAERDATNPHTKKSGTEKKLAKKFRALKVLEFNGLHEVSRFRCECGRTFKIKTSKLLKSKRGRCFACEAGEVKVAKVKTYVMNYEGTSYTVRNKLDEDVIVMLAGRKEVIKANKKPVTYKYAGQERGYKAPFTVRKTIRMDCLSYEELKAQWKHWTARGMACKGNLLLVVDVDSRMRELTRGWEKWKTFSEVEKFLRGFQDRKLRIMCMDPGVTNHAWAILEASPDTQPKVVATGMIQRTVRALNGDIKSEVNGYVGELLQIAETYAANAFIMERFQTRGMKGVTIELVNTMLGCVLSQLASVMGVERLKLLTASQWKNEWNRYSDLEKFYTRVKKATVHQVDAVGIGLYGASFWLDLKPFETIKKLERTLAKDIDKASLHKHR